MVKRNILIKSSILLSCFILASCSSKGKIDNDIDKNLDKNQSSEIDKNNENNENTDNLGIKVYNIDLNSNLASQILEEYKSKISNINDLDLNEQKTLAIEIMNQMQKNNDSGNIVYFDFNSYDLNDEGTKKINDISKILIQFPSEKVRVAGYTDAIGSDSYNFSLGQRRATSVYDGLLSQGVNPSQVCTVSYGSSDSIVNAEDLQKVGCKFQGDKPIASLECKKAFKQDRKSIIRFGKTCNDNL